MTPAGRLWLLDTNIISSLMKEPKGNAAQRLLALLQEDEKARIGTSVIVSCELRFGLERLKSRRLNQAYTAAMSAILVFPLEANVEAHYASLRFKLESSGTPIGPNDMLIAAHALALDAILVTDNDREFQRVPRLRIENWLHL